MGGGPDSSCVGRVCGLYGAVRLAAALRTTTHSKTRCRKLNINVPDDGRMRPKHV